MRIAHTVSSLNNASAGPSYSVPGLARGQASLGASVTLHSLEGRPVLGGDGVTDIRHRRDLAHILVLGRLGVSRDMRRSLAGGGYDVVHTHGLWLMANNYRVRDAAFVISPRGMLTEVALTFSPLKKRAVSLMCQERNLRAATLFHATAQEELEDIRSYGLTQPVAVIPNGIDIPGLETRASSPRRKLITLGRIHPKKGLDGLISAWARVAPRFPDWDLEIIGPDQNNHRSALEAQARNLGVTRLTFRKAVHGPEKQTLMAAADLFILPSLSENFGITVAESLALSVPVIATKGTPWSGLEVQSCGWWVNHSPEELAGAMAHAMSLPRAELQLKGSNGRAWMKREFSWAGIAAMTLSAYRWVLGQGDRPDFVHTD